MLHFMDLTGNALATTVLDSSVPLAGYPDRTIMIEGVSADDANSYWLQIEVTSLNPRFNPCPAIVSPEGGTYDPMQAFALGVIYEPNATPVPMTVRNNGNPIPVNCVPGFPNQYAAGLVLLHDLGNF